MRAFILFTLFLSITINNSKAVTSNSPLETTEEKIIRLQTLHQSIYNLPFDREYITGTIMGEVSAKRIEVAPHFPNRSQTGSDENLVKTAFTNWIVNYPDEYDKYMEETTLIARKYKSMSK